MVTLPQPRIGSSTSHPDAAAAAALGAWGGGGGVGGAYQQQQRRIGSEDFAVGSPQGSWGGSADLSATTTAGGEVSSGRFAASSVPLSAGVRGASSVVPPALKPERTLWPAEDGSGSGADEYDAAGFETMQQQGDYRELVRQSRAGGGD